MRNALMLLLAAALIAGCSTNNERPAGRTPVRIDELAIPVRGGSRSYMQSDREGAFLTGTVGAADGDRWSVGGTEVLRGFVVESPEGVLSADRLDSARILPFETARFYRGGTSVSVSGLEKPGGADVHALLFTVRLPHPGRVTLRALPAPGSAGSSQDHLWSWRLNTGLQIVIAAGNNGSVTADGISCDGAEAAAKFLVCAIPAGADGGIASALYGRANTLLAERKSRMERLLNASFFRSSDDTLDLAVHWMMLALDGLMVDRGDTFAVDGLPWDGSIDVRDNAQSIAGLGLATGDFQRTAGIFRSLAHYQDIRNGSRTFGRLPDRIVNGRPSYGGADVTPWFVRELYDQVVNTGDTTLLRALYPLVARSIDGTLRTHVDKSNLLVHGPRETWMKNIERGNRAVEIEGLWYFQQLIGRFIASYISDSLAWRRWENLPERTAESFTRLFADTAAKTLADHLNADGTRSTEVRPNALMCLEMLEDEGMRHGVTRAAVTGLLTGSGIRTLLLSDPRARGSAAAPGGEYNGPVWTWLAGPAAYALTRYDRQDISFPLARGMASLALRTDMAGTLPAMLDPGPAGKRASLSAMAEFIRSMYQDYLGAHVDVAAGSIVFQPKLPAALSLMQFTVYAGSSPVEVEYRRGKDNARLSISAPRLATEMKVSFLWMMESGDAWRGSFRLKEGVPAAIVLGEDDAVMYQGESKGEIDGKRKLKGFSQRKDAFDLSPAP